IPGAAVEAVKQEVLDSLATALGGSPKAGIGELVDMVKEWGGNGQSTIVAYGIKCAAPDAAQVNGSMIHSLDYDDGHSTALVHVGCVAISTSFAVAERMGKTSGKDFITAIALGEDFDSRLGLASRPGSTALGLGWHPTTLFGHLTSASIAGKLMRLDEDKMIDALGLAYHQCGGAGSGGGVSLSKRMGPGFAAKAGVTAALMAERGITGDRSPLEGRDGRGGIYNTYAGGDYDVNILTGDLGKRFEGVNIGYKPYPCCGFSHPFIDATFSLREKYDIKADQIREITALGGESGYFLCQPIEIKRAPRNHVDAQFSVPWTVSTALIKGKVTLEDFTDEAIKNKDILNVAQKVTGQLDDNMTKHGVSPGRVTIVMNDGTEYSEFVEDNLGSVENPMSFDDCARKFRECSSCALKPLPAETVEKVIEMVRNLEELDDVREIIELVS
ncbi:MmgE/PrpD family protein, partial [Chloroflexota bacterium]